MEAAVEVTRFQLTAPSSTSIKEQIHFDDPRFHLHIVQKKEVRTERPVIESSKGQRLAYYRAFTTSGAKSEVMPVQHADINSFLWIYTLNLFFKTVPHSFVHFFLAAYAPDEHMFVTKMVPICHGIKYLFVITGVLDVLICVDLLVLLLQYCIKGILLKNPWNSCPEPRIFTDLNSNVSVHCFNIPEFKLLFNNKTYFTDDFTYIVDDKHHFQVSQIEYYRIHVYYAEYVRDCVFFIVIWSLLTLLHKFAVRKYYWKVIYWVQNCIIVIDILTFMYIMLTLYDAEKPQVAKILDIDAEQADKFWATDIDLLAESITAPPIVHVLTSRSTQEIDPASDSATMVLSNAIFYIFKGLHRLKLQDHCESMLNTQIPITQFNQHQMFYFFPIFWTHFYLGDIFSNSYFLLTFIQETLVVAVTYNCVVECITYEWPKFKRWMVMIAIYAAGVLMFIFTTVDQRIVLWTYGKGIATLLEASFLYIFYPVGRLVDDYTFLYGHTPTKLRLWSMRLVPVYYSIKLYIMMDSIWAVMNLDNLAAQVKHYTWSWAMLLMPIILGMAYIIYKYLAVYRMTWNYILRPKPKWGPQEFSERQLRKQFDSRYYIGSEAPKLLIRYLNGKRESKVYKIDVRYDYYRRSTVSPMAVRFGMKRDS